MNQPDPMLTTEELGQYLHQPASTIRYWRHTGTGPRGVKLGRRVLYRLSDVDAWVEARYAKAGS